MGGLDAHASSRPLASPAMRAMPAGERPVPFARTEYRALGFSSAWLTSRELPPCDPRPCCHRRIRCSRRVGCCRGSARQEADGITAHDRIRRNRSRHGAAGRVGDLLLARVVGLGRAYFPFGPQVRSTCGDSYRLRRMAQSATRTSSSEWCILSRPSRPSQPYHCTVTT